MRGIRGAICASENTREAIFSATQQLLREILRRNGLRNDEIVSAFFTMTPDLDADFPAYAARDMGWTEVPMLGAQESLVPGAPPRSIRVMLLAEGRGATRHVYLGRAAAMRPDLAEPGDEEWGEAADRVPPGEGGLMGRLLVVGLGLIGGSLAAAARRSGCFSSVRGFDRDGAAADAAVERRHIDAAGSDLAEELRGADIVVLAAPVAEILRLLPEVGRWTRRGALITDVGSTKRSIVEAMNSLPAELRAVGGHPMAGSTASGAAAASADLFQGAKWALVRTERSDAEALQRSERLVRLVGARAVHMSAQLHDRIVAVTSQLPALVSVGLVQLAGHLADEVEGDLFLAGPGLVSATRLAAGEPVMTAQMMTDNSEYIGSAIEDLVEGLKQLRESVAGDIGSLRDRLVEAAAKRAALVEQAAEAARIVPGGESR